MITTASGLHFESAFRNSSVVDIEGLAIRIPSLTDLILNKKATGRTKDLADVEVLEEMARCNQQDPLA
jgi:hypothetical protein